MVRSWSSMTERARRSAPPLAHAAVEHDLHGFVPGEGALDLLVELPPMARDEEQMPGDGQVLGRAAGVHLPAAPTRCRFGLRHELEKARGRCPRGAPAGGARRVTEFEAFIAVQAEGQLAEREVEAVGQHPGAIEHVIVYLHAPRSKTQSTPPARQKSAT